MAGKKQKARRETSITQKFFAQGSSSSSKAASKPASKNSDPKTTPQEPSGQHEAPANDVQKTQSKKLQQQQAFLESLLPNDNWQALQKFAEQGEDPVVGRNIRRIYREAEARLVGYHAGEQGVIEYGREKAEGGEGGGDGNGTNVQGGIDSARIERAFARQVIGGNLRGGGSLDGGLGSADSDGSGAEDVDVPLPRGGLDGETTVSEEDVVQKSKRIRKRNRRRRKGKNKGKVELSEEMRDGADIGYTTAPEGSPDVPQKRPFRTRFTEVFEEVLEFDQAKLNEDANRQGLSDTETSYTKRERAEKARPERERIEGECIERKDKGTEKGNTEGEHMERERTERECPAPGVSRNGKAAAASSKASLSDIRSKADHTRTDAENPEKSSFRSEIADHLEVTILNLDGFERKHVEQGEQVEHHHELAEEEANSSGAAIDPRDPLQHDKLLRYLHAIENKALVLSTSIGFLNFEAEYTDIEKRWGLVAEAVSRAENRGNRSLSHLARELGHEYFEPYPTSMLEALNCPAFCAREMQRQQPKVKKSGTTGMNKDFSVEEVMAHVDSMLKISLKDIDASRMIKLSDDVSDRSGMAGVILLGDALPPETPEWVKQEASDFDFTLCEMKQAQQHLFPMRDRARIAIQTWKRAHEPAWSLGRKHWREIPVTMEYEYYRNDFFAMWENSRWVERKLQVYFFSEEGRKFMSPKLHRRLKYFWPDIDEDTATAHHRANKRFNIIFDTILCRLPGVREIIELLEKLISKSTSMPNFQHDEMEPCVEQWKMLTESEADFDKMITQLEDDKQLLNFPSSLIHRGVLDK